MARTSAGHRRRIGIMLAALALLAGCNESQKQDSAEREFNAWANDVERQGGNGQAAVDFEEPANVMARVIPTNAQRP
jgi:hypothetical protein